MQIPTGIDTPTRRRLAAALGTVLSQMMAGVSTRPPTGWARQSSISRMPTRTRTV
jgi:hypothetical protein